MSCRSCVACSFLPRLNIRATCMRDKPKCLRPIARDWMRLPERKVALPDAAMLVVVPLLRVCILIAATVGLWFAAGTVRNSSGSSSPDPCTETLKDHSIEITYDDYLGFAGILVIMLIFAIGISVFVGLGLSVDSLPAAAKILAAACSLVPLVALLLFLVWLGLGTAMAVFCQSNSRALVYIGLMWLYFLIVLTVGIIAILLMARTAKRAVQKALQ